MNKSFSLSDLFIFAVIILSTFLLPALELGRFATVILIPLFFLKSFLTQPKRIKYIGNLKPIRYYLLFFGWASISIFYAKYLEAAILTQSKFLIVLIFSLAVMSYSIISIHNLQIVYYSFIITLILLFSFVIFSGLNLNQDTRIDDGLLNANSYGYYIFNGLFACLIIYAQLKKNKLIALIFLLPIIFFSFYIVIVSGSRGSFIILSLLVIIGFFIIYYVATETKVKKGFVFILLISTGAYLASYSYTNYVKNSIVMDRFNQLEEKESPRSFHIRKAIEIGLTSPIIGIGAGNYAQTPKMIEKGSFSHNTYTEIFVNYGLIGLLVYFSFFISMFRKTIKLVKRTDTQTKVTLYLMLLYLILFLVYNMFYVTFLTAEFTSMLFVILAHVHILKSKIKQY
ncbi:MAG: O-antigen ligase family protein [Crocinitomicaceae bacterium]